MLGLRPAWQAGSWGDNLAAGTSSLVLSPVARCMSYWFRHYMHRTHPMAFLKGSLPFLSTRRVGAAGWSLGMNWDPGLWVPACGRRNGILMSCPPWCLPKGWCLVSGCFCPSVCPHLVSISGKCTPYAFMQFLDPTSLVGLCWSCLLLLGSDGPLRF